MTIGEDRKRDQFENESFAMFEKFRFMTTVRLISRRNAFVLPIRVSTYLFCRWWIPLQGTWSSQTEAVICRLLVAHIDLGVL